MKNPYNQAVEKKIKGDLECEVSELFPEGLPRQCKHCGVWARYKKPGKGSCFTVNCKSCFKEFDIVIGMKGARY